MWRSAPGCAPRSRLPGPRRGIVATAIYHGLGLGLRSAGAGLGAAGRAGVGPRLEDRPTGRFLSSAVNGLIGDRLRDQRPGLAIPMAVRVDGADVPLTTGHLAAAFPDATGRVVVFLHGLSEHEGHWDRHRDRHGTTYGEALAAAGWTPVFLRLNTGLAIRENGAALAALLQDLADAWPGGIDRLALVGHSMGGLVIRSACAVRTDADRPWAERVSDVVTLGTPHLGAPLADQVGRGAVAMGRLPETAAFGRILDWRSVGVRDLVAGLAEEVPALPHARYRLVCATLTELPTAPGRPGPGRRPGAGAVGLRPRSAGRPVPRRRGAARAARRAPRPAQPSARPRGARRLARLTAQSTSSRWSTSVIETCWSRAASGPVSSTISPSSTRSVSSGPV